MYKIKIICVGKLKERYLSDFQNEYLKRLKKYAEIQLIEVKDEIIPDKSNEAIENKVKDKEFENILKYIKNDDYIIALDLYGKEYDSLSFASHMKLVFDTKQNITFIIAGSLGYGSKLNEYVKEKVKLSSLTFPHQIARLLLLEQIYRSFKINSNEIYHK